MRAARVVGPRDATRGATHLAAAHPDGPCGEQWAADLLRRAAAAALARGGGEEAIAYLRRALDEPLSAEERLGVLLEAGGLEAQARDYTALEHLAEAATLASDPVQRGRIALARGDALFHMIALEECSRVCREAIAGLDGADRELRLALEATALNADGVRGVNRERPADLAADVEAAATAGERAVLIHVVADMAATGSTPAGQVRELGTPGARRGGPARGGGRRLPPLHLRRHRARLGRRLRRRAGADHRGTGTRPPQRLAGRDRLLGGAARRHRAAGRGPGPGRVRLRAGRLRAARRRPDGLRGRPRLADRNPGRAQPARGRPCRARAQRPDRRAAGAGHDRLPADGARPADRGRG